MPECRDCSEPIEFVRDAETGSVVPVDVDPKRMVAPRDDVPDEARKLRRRFYVPTMTSREGLRLVRRRSVYPEKSGVDGRIVDAFADHRSSCVARKPVRR